MKYLVILLVVALSFLLLGCSSNALDSFAECLTDKGAEMYGAYWCPHCVDQKAAFGDSWKKVFYVECSLPNRAGQTAVCAQRGIQSYPTWRFADGTERTGQVTLADLAVLTGCELP
jgi:hypothetical protein